MEKNWAIFLLITALIYAAPTVYRIWKLRKRKASMSRHPAGKTKQHAEPSALLGVVYPHNDDTTKDNH